MDCNRFHCFGWAENGTGIGIGLAIAIALQRAVKGVGFVDLSEGSQSTPRPIVIVTLRACKRDYWPFQRQSCADRQAIPAGQDTAFRRLLATVVC